eukprot:7745769-Pyramimonas_sp.AAC.1
MVRVTSGRAGLAGTGNRQAGGRAVMRWAFFHGGLGWRPTSCSLRPRRLKEASNRALILRELVLLKETLP